MSRQAIEERNALQATLARVEAERDALQAKLAAIGKLNPTDYDDREALLCALLRILQGQAID